MIIIVDYGLGNIKSVSRAMEKLGAEVLVTSEPAIVKKADGVVLPGVGAFRKAVKNLNDLGLWECLREYIEDSRPYLGICLGLQLLFTKSNEHGKTNGFGIIKGSVERLPEGVKIPHMGWNQVLLSDDAVISRKISSSASSSVYLSPASTGSPASTKLTNSTPFTTRPSFTSRHGMILLASINKIP